METLLLALLKLLCFVMRVVPRTAAFSFIYLIIRLVVLFMPKLRAVALRNLEIAFPALDSKSRAAIYRESWKSFANLLVDSARLSSLSAGWLTSHVRCDMLERYIELKRLHPGTGVVLATGHLGNFEVMGQAMAAFGHPISFVVRNFKMKRIDQWWVATRERLGNRVIARKGALKEVVESLKSGRDVAILFDQNVRDKHAVFVDWFSVPAATTKLPAIAALRAEAPVIVASMEYLGNESYILNAVECDCFDLYRRDDLDYEDKVREITQRISALYVEMIRRRPSEWFWMHRRWRTRPPGDKGAMYE